MRSRAFLVLTLISLFAFQASAEILFEGYIKVLVANKHVGFGVQRYEIDSKKKQFINVNLLKFSIGGVVVTEGLKTISDLSFNPISYQYTRVEGNQAKTIDAVIKKNKMTGTIYMANKKTKISADVPKGSFFSSVLAYMLLSSPTGLKTDSRYDYQAIVEEDANLVKGSVVVEKEEQFNGISAFRTVNSFKGDRWISLVTGKGEVLKTEAPTQGVKSELVATPQEAIADIGLPVEIVKQLFGNTPQGLINVIASSKNTTPTTLAK
jgi:hypothetical protein